MARVGTDEGFVAGATSQDAVGDANDDDNSKRIRVRAQDDEEVEWSLRAVEKAHTLSDQINECAGGTLKVELSAWALDILGKLSDGTEEAGIEQLSIKKLAELIKGAIYLDSQPALEYCQRVFAAQLKGKCADKLRELLCAQDDFESDEKRRAALAESMFECGSSDSLPQSVSTGPPALQLQASLLDDDAKAAVLSMVDVGTLAELKGVNRSWCALARQSLCKRFCGCSCPTKIEELNVEALFQSGRLWEVVKAGKCLAQLKKLKGYGFDVNVDRVRSLNLGRPCWKDCKNALIPCLTGEGEPPLALLVSVIVCAGSGLVCRIPVEAMRADSLSSLNLPHNIGLESAKIVGALIPGMSNLTEVCWTPAHCHALSWTNTLCSCVRR